MSHSVSVQVCRCQFGGKGKFEPVTMELAGDRLIMETHLGALTRLTIARRVGSTAVCSTPKKVRLHTSQCLCLSMCMCLCLCLCLCMCLSCVPTAALAQARKGEPHALQVDLVASRRLGKGAVLRPDNEGNAKCLLHSTSGAFFAQSSSSHPTKRLLHRSRYILSFQSAESLVEWSDIFASLDPKVEARADRGDR